MNGQVSIKYKFRNIREVLENEICRNIREFLENEICSMFPDSAECFETVGISMCPNRKQPF